MVAEYGMRMLVLILVSCFATGARKDDCPVEQNKCTAKDPRMIYPVCMLYSVDESLWCDQSIYRSIPNPKTILPYTSCERARALYINDSCLQDLRKEELSEYPIIRKFDCGSNYIQKLRNNLFTGNRGLQIIDFCSNRIERIEQHALKGLTKLRILNLANNKIRELHTSSFHALKSLQELSLHNNALERLGHRTFVGLHGLRMLELSANNLVFIDEKTFNHMSKLTHLILDDNKLQTLHPHLFRELVNLEVLTMSYNELTMWNSEAKLPKVHTLNLAQNYIEYIEGESLAFMEKLQILSLQNNSLTSINESTFHQTPHMRVLNFADNRLEQIPKQAFSRLCHLEVLILRNNNLKIPHPEWFQKIMANDCTPGSDISRNAWSCECDILEFQDFLENPEAKDWAEELEVICQFPRDLQDQKLDRNVREEILGISGCVVNQKEPEIVCTKLPEFVRVPQIDFYAPTHHEYVQYSTPMVTFHPTTPNEMTTDAAIETTVEISKIPINDHSVIVIVFVLVVIVMGSLGIIYKYKIRSDKVRYNG